MDDAKNKDIWRNDDLPMNGRKDKGNPPSPEEWEKRIQQEMDKSPYRKEKLRQPDLRVLSRKLFAEGPSSLANIEIGSLQRIADSLERMERPYLEQIIHIKNLQEANERLREQIRAKCREFNGAQGYIKKLENEVSRLKANQKDTYHYANIKLEMVNCLMSYESWTNKGPYNHHRETPEQKLLFIDADGYVLNVGADFKSCKYPIEVYRSVLIRKGVNHES